MTHVSEAHSPYRAFVPADAGLSLYGDGALLSPDTLSDRFGISKTELAHVLGVSRDAVSKRSRIEGQALQKKLRDMAGIITRVLNWSGSLLSAYAWYRTQPIASFGDRTAETLVKSGEGEAVRAYLDRIAEGGFA